MAYCSAAQAVAALHLVSYDPHLHNKAAQLDNQTTSAHVPQSQQWILQAFAKLCPKADHLLKSHTTCSGQNINRVCLHGQQKIFLYSPGPGAQLRLCVHYWRCAPRRSPEGSSASHHICTTGYLKQRSPVHHETCREILSQQEYESWRFTVVIDGVDRRPADTHLLQLLFRRGGDVVPAVSCRGRQNTTQQKWHSIQQQTQVFQLGDTRASAPSDLQDSGPRRSLCERQNRPWRYPTPGWQPRWRWTWRAGQSQHVAMMIPGTENIRTKHLVCCVFYITLINYKTRWFLYSWMRNDHLAQKCACGCSQQMELTAGVSVVTPSRQRTSPLLLMAHRGTTSTLLWAAHGRMVTSLSVIGGISCQGPVVASLHFLRQRKTRSPWQTNCKTMQFRD